MSKGIQTLRLAALRIIMAVLACLTPVATASAQQSELPEIDLFVYHDLSGSMFSGGEDRPANRMRLLLNAVVNENLLPEQLADRVGQRKVLGGDGRLRLYGFGGTAETRPEASCDGRVWPIVEGELRTPDQVETTLAEKPQEYQGKFNSTDFRCLFADVAENQELERSIEAGRQAVVIIASDFLHDPFNKSLDGGRLTGICSYLEMFSRNELPEDLDTQLQRVAQLRDENLERDGLYEPVFVLFRAEYGGGRKKGSNEEDPSQYDQCAISITSNSNSLLAGIVRERLEARDYVLSEDVQSFAEELSGDLLAATQRRLEIRATRPLQLSPSGQLGRLTFSLRNPSQFRKMTLQSIFLSDDLGRVGSIDLEDINKEVRVGERREEEVTVSLSRVPEVGALKLKALYRYEGAKDRVESPASSVSLRREAKPRLEELVVSPLPNKEGQFVVTVRLDDGDRREWTVKGATLTSVQDGERTLKFPDVGKVKDGATLSFSSDVAIPDGAELRVRLHDGRIDEDVDLVPLRLTPEQVASLGVEGAQAYLAKAALDDSSPTLTFEGLRPGNDGVYRVDTVQTDIDGKTLTLTLTTPAVIDSSGKLEINKNSIRNQSGAKELFDRLEEAPHALKLRLRRVDAGADEFSGPVTATERRYLNVDLDCPVNRDGGAKWTTLDDGRVGLEFWFTQQSVYGAETVREVSYNGVQFEVTPELHSGVGAQSVWRVGKTFNAELMRAKQKVGFTSAKGALLGPRAEKLCDLSIPAFNNDSTDIVPLELVKDSVKRTSERDGFELRLRHSTPYMAFSVDERGGLFDGLQADRLASIDVTVDTGEGAYGGGLILPRTSATVTLRIDGDWAPAELVGKWIRLHTTPGKDAEPLWIEITPEHFEFVEVSGGTWRSDAPIFDFTPNTGERLELGVVMLRSGGAEILRHDGLVDREVTPGQTEQLSLNFSEHLDKLGELMKAAQPGGRFELCILRKGVDAAGPAGAGPPDAAQDDPCAAGGGGKWEPLEEGPPSSPIVVTNAESGAEGLSAELKNLGPYPALVSVVEATSALGDSLSLALADGPFVLLPDEVRSVELRYPSEAEEDLALQSGRLWLGAGDGGVTVDVVQTRLEFLAPKHAFLEQPFRWLHALVMGWRESLGLTTRELAWVLTGEIRVSRADGRLPDGLEIELEAQRGDIARIGGDRRRVEITEGEAEAGARVFRYAVEIGPEDESDLRVRATYDEGARVVAMETLPFEKNGYELWRRVFRYLSLIGAVVVAFTVVQPGIAWRGAGIAGFSGPSMGRAIAVGTVAVLALLPVVAGPHLESLYLQSLVSLWSFFMSTPVLGALLQNFFTRLPGARREGRKDWPVRHRREVRLRWLCGFGFVLAAAYMFAIGQHPFPSVSACTADAQIKMPLAQACLTEDAA